MNRCFRSVVLSVSATVLLFSQTAQSQQTNPANMLGYKDPGTSTLIGVLVTGGGQFYSGETAKGATLLGIGLGSLVVGAAASGVSCSGYSCSSNTAPLLLGYVAYLGTWIYGLMDAGNAARRHNAALGLKTVGAVPVAKTFADGRKGLGISVTLP